MIRHPRFEKSLDGAETCVREVWGYDGLRPAQRDVITEVLGGRDVLAVLPTGGGKSLLYQVPALLDDGLVLVVSPLIALMADQVASLSRRGVAAVAVNSTMPWRAVEQAFIDARYGKYKLLFLAPERLQTDVFAQAAPHLGVSLLAVDEAHCVSEWAPHFRPAYREIAAARALVGHPPVLAVTATATPEVRRDIGKWLRLDAPAVIVRGFDRPNLGLSVVREDNKRARVLRIVTRLSGAGILYASTRRDVEAWCAWLRSRDVPAVAYHGGMPPEQREAAARRWMADEARVMVATNAFGMGIDKSDVRFVVHVDVPASLEAYYQEAGRAGRDGAPAEAVLLWQPRDLDTQRTLISTAHPTRPQVAQVFDAIGNLAQVAVGALPEAPVRADLDKVGALVQLPRSAVETALTVLERGGALTRVAGFGDGWFGWALTRDALLRQAFGPAVEGFVKSLVRALPQEAFREDVEVRLRDVARRVGMPPGRLARGLAYLQQRGYARWQPSGDTVRLQLLVPRTRRLALDDAWLERAREAATTRLAHVERFLTSSVCRRRFVLGYFGEGAADACGRCDVCRRGARRAGPEKGQEEVLLALLEGCDESAPGADETARHLLSWLLREEYVQCTDVLAGRYALTERGAALRHRLREAAGRPELP